MNVLLVIAEDRAVCQGLRAALPASDLPLFEPTVQRAARRLVSLRADAILLDDGPALGGQAIAAVKAAAPDTPVILLSARGDAVTRAGLSRAGADAVVVKPFSCETLRETVDTLVAERAAPYSTPPVPRDVLGPSSVLNQHQMALRWLSRASAQSDDPVRLSQSLAESVADVFDAVRCAVLLERDDTVRVAASYGIADAVAGPLRLDFSTGLMRWFDEHACLIDRETAFAPPDAVKELHVLSARIAAPLLREGRVIGAIALGEKASGAAYSREERELLTLVARCASMAFERAGSHARTSERQMQLDAIFGHMDAGVVAVSPDKTITIMNSRAEAILEVRAADMTGQRVQKLGSAFADAVLRTLSGGEATPQQIIRDPAIGADLSITVTPLGTQAGVVAIFTRVAEETVAADDVAYSPFWEYLSSRVAQEVKNPMVAINTFAQLLPRKYDSEDFREAFSDVVQQEVGRINRVVETLFDFARNPQLTLRRCSVNETVKNVLKSFEEELERRAIKLSAEWGAEVSDADMDPEFFSQAVHNVVQNSIEAMPDGGTLSVSTISNLDQTEIRIADTGSGVAPDDTSRIFLPFYSTKERGMGLGLPLASRIMRQHRGDVTLLDGVRTGSCFAIHLPAVSGEMAGNKEREDP